MENIKLRARLSAYTKGILPSKISELEQDIDYITDVPDDGSIYMRRHNEWVRVVEDDEPSENPEEPINPGETIIGGITLAENSGLKLVRDNGKNIISVKQQVLIDSEIPSDFECEEDTTYYIVETTPNTYINGGTAFSDGYTDSILDEEVESEYTQIIFGGNCNQRNFDVMLKPLNSKGVLYNG